MITLPFLEECEYFIENLGQVICPTSVPVLKCILLLCSISTNLHLDPLVYFLYISFKKKKEIYSVPLTGKCIWRHFSDGTDGTDGTDERGISGYTRLFCMGGIKRPNHLSIYPICPIKRTRLKRCFSLCSSCSLEHFEKLHFSLQIQHRAALKRKSQKQRVGVDGTDAKHQVSHTFSTGSCTFSAAVEATASLCCW